MASESLRTAPVTVRLLRRPKHSPFKAALQPERSRWRQCLVRRRLRTGACGGRWQSRFGNRCWAESGVVPFAGRVMGQSVTDTPFARWLVAESLDPSTRSGVATTARGGLLDV